MLIIPNSMANSALACNTKYMVIYYFTVNRFYQKLIVDAMNFIKYTIITTKHTIIPSHKFVWQAMGYALLVLMNDSSDTA